MAARIQILNLVPEKSAHNATDQQKQESRQWRLVGEIVGHSTVRLDSIVWPGGHLVPASTPKGARSVFRVVTALAPPFVMEGELDEDGQCLRGLECHRLLTSDKDNLTLVFNDMDRMEDADPKHHLWGISYPRYKYVTSCCYGLTMDLLENVAEELEFDFHLYVVADGMHGSRKGAKKWNGVVGDLMSGAAHMSFAALSVNSPRSEVIDFSVPYFFSGVSLLAAPKQRTDIPLLAFLLPFSPELWIAIFTSLNVTAVAVAIYEWLSPFGLNPWGRQRSKNFSMSSAMWVCWGLLCGHLVAFKAPKSWPNKFLINVWGGFSVIFVASYTANIAALIAGLFFQNAVGDYHDRSLLSQRVATPKASAADYYIHKANQMLWDHVQKYSVTDVAEGVKHLKNGTLDVLIADTPILDYYRATDNGCKLMKFGDTINEDTYAVGMTKGFPLKDSISAVMAKYSSNGYMDILQEKWYGGLPCFKLATEMAQPRPLGVAAVAGVFLLLGLGMVVGCLILLAEHLFYRYTLPILRHKPKGTIWRSRNIMFFSQKLYRFINCVELVSPHHAARELVHTIRQGQITSLFQKSVKRKEHEQRRRRRSKAQFFEMIQEIRRVQQEERVSTVPTPHLSLPAGEGGRSPRSKKLQLTRSPQFLSPPDPHRRNSRLPTRLELARRLSRDVFRSKSSGNLRRMSSDISMGRLLDCHSSQAIGRRLSRDTNLSPPDINSRRASYLSDGRRVPSMDIGSSCDITAPKSPNYLTMPGHIPTVQSIPDNILTPSGLLPDAAVSRFSYIDIKSPSFVKNKLSHRHEPAGLSLSLGDRHPTSWSSSFTEVNPRVIVCDNNELDQGLSIVDQPKQENATINQDVSAAKRPSIDHRSSSNDQKPSINQDVSAAKRPSIDHRWSSNDQKPSINQDVSAAKRPSIDQRWSTNDQKFKTDQKHTAERSSFDQKHNVDDYSNAQKTRTGDRPPINSNDQKHSSFDHPPDHSLTNNEQKLMKQSSWSNSSVNSTEHMIQIIIPSEDSASANDKGTSSGSSAVTTIKSSPKVTHQKPPIAIKPPKVVTHPKPPSVKSSPKVVVADQKMALNMVLNELKERCKEVNAATASDAAPPTAPPKIVSYIPKKPARKSLETVQRSLDEGSGAAVEKRRAAVEQQRGKSLDRMGDHRTSSTDKLVDKPPPLPAKKERRRVHKVRSSECCERLSVAETQKCATEAACGTSHATCDRTRDRRPLVTSRSNDEATSNRVVRDDAISARPEKRHPVSSSSLDRKDVTSSKAST
ncbi:hypothetical protein LSTR_LSTR006593 [Laodelphax striatellus]|uniref:Ionotropic glutamate receptor C-terminal domain-containing protein n=1 Tax=Laodelphax striatellus TaxID=195883 RepID=A0A482X0J8_LAOST|nr:hypothetical protein LSTR_LSTR006593 [Laodelphax striatellus]